ncbi:MAG: helix-turn-helix domain-containing protein [Flavobacteriaceae bacterium]|nr:helix-turn-helix domain-containing protein [Flavobacteriaceae bacterium]
MFSNEELINNTGYWLDKIQNELYFELNLYMKKNKLNRTQLAKELGFTKGYITQVLNGNFNYSLKKLIDLSLAIGLVPNINFSKVNDEIINLNKLNSARIIELKVNTYCSLNDFLTEDVQKYA